MDKNEFKEKLSKIFSTLAMEDAALYLLARSTRIIVKRDLEFNAATDGWSIYLSPQYFSLPPRQQVKTLAHELLHIVLLHPTRGKRWLEKNPNASPLYTNVIADAIVNDRLTPPFKPEEGEVRLEHFAQNPDELEELRRMSYEELLDRFKNKVKTEKITVPLDILTKGAAASNSDDTKGAASAGSKRGSSKESEDDGRDKVHNERDEGLSEAPEKRGKRGPKGTLDEKEDVKGNGEGASDTNADNSARPLDEKESEERGGGDEEVLNEGEGELPSSPEEVEERVKEKTLRIFMSTKAAGRVPAWLERTIDELLKPEISWRKLLRQFVEKGLGHRVRKTWSRPSRKHPTLPGKETLSTNTIIVLVDTSGSIDEETLCRFVSEVYGLAREAAKVVVVPWDAVAYDPIIIRRPSDIKKVTIRGGGGTMIAPALRLVEEKYKNQNQMIIISDWWIGDLNDDYVRTFFERNARRIIAVTVDDDPPKVFGERVIRIKPHKR